jgi:hypothetical protein
MNKYFCFILGENQKDSHNWHRSTLTRAKSFAISIHLPVFIWLIIGYLLSTQIFGLSESLGALVAALCGITIFMIERLVIAAPKSRSVTIGRLVIALVVGIIGSAGLDLVLFDKEIETQLKVSANNNLSDKYQALIAEQTAGLEQLRNQWKIAEEKALCEANGTCGSGVRSVGPVFREAKRHADNLRSDFERAEIKLEALKASFASDARALAADTSVVSSAGLLARINALHQYIFTDGLTFAVWLVLFVLVTCIELMVVFIKLSFGDTVDDEIARLKERIRIHKAQEYAAAVMSPYAEANDLINSLQQRA